MNKGKAFKKSLKGLSTQLDGSFEDIRYVEHGRIKALINDNAQTRITYEIVTSKGRFVTNVAVAKDEGVLVVTGIYLESIDAPLEEITRFTFDGKSSRHYAFFFLALAVPLFVLYAMYLAYRSGTHMRWIWIICMFPGTGNVSINWVSGRFSSNIFSISTLWAPFYRDGLSGASYITLAVPFVAGIYVYSRWKRSRRSIYK